jgi:hypothetical protein
MVVIEEISEEQYNYDNVMTQLNAIWVLNWFCCYDNYEKYSKILLCPDTIINENNTTKINRNYIVMMFFFCMRNPEYIMKDIYKYKNRQDRKYSKRNDLFYDSINYDDNDSAYDFDSSSSENYDSD